MKQYKKTSNFSKTKSSL